MSQGTRKRTRRGPIAWMAGNSVAANILMLVLLVGGLFMGTRVKQEIFPEFSMDRVNVSIAYPGASPEEVENSLVLVVEEAVQGLEGVEEITSTASEGLAVVTVEALKGADVNRLWQDIKGEVDRIGTFPEEAKEPQVSIVSRKRGVVDFVLYGQEDERVLRDMAELIRDRLLQDEGITQVDLAGVRDYQIHVEVGQAALRRYDLTLYEIAAVVGKASVELGGGALKTPGGEILVKVDDLRESGSEYARLPLITDKDGGQVLLEDVAEVREGFEESDTWATYNGQRAVLINVYRVGDQTPVEVAAAARRVAEELNSSLPGGLKLAILNDRSEVYSQRAELLLSNAYLGLFLVFLLLAVFLEARLAFWVSLGIPISFLGSFLILPGMGFTLNMITMFAFIVTLGIVVDDAIVVGENIYSQRQQGKSFLTAAIDGAREVSTPVVFSVITNVVAFMPLYFVPGFMGKVFKFIPLVVGVVFFLSLVESLFILPAHLGHGKERVSFPPLAWLLKKQVRLSQAIEHWIYDNYAPFLRFTLRHRYATVALGVALLVATVGFMSSGRMGLTLFPKVEADYAYVEATLPYGSSMDRARELETRLVDAAREVVLSTGGEEAYRGVFSEVQNNVVEVRLYLAAPEVRPLSTLEVTRLWSKTTGPIAGLEAISFESDRGGPGSGKGLTVRLSHRDRDVLEQAGVELAAALEDYGNVSDIDDGSAQGKRQYDIHLLPAGQRMGLTSQDVANQVRHAFYGVEAVRQQRGRNEVTVLVSLPEAERRDQATFENLVLRTPSGGEIYLRDAVEMAPGRAYTSISHTDGRRVISVTANVTPQSEAERIVAALKADVLPNLVARHPGLSFSFQGRQAEMRDSVNSLVSGLLLALLVIFAMLAIPFKSYVQPLIVMFCIPFGIVGAVAGHLIMGYALCVMSLFGVVALSGVVVNDSLVLIDFANRSVRKGLSPLRAIEAAGVKRFRPILLTTLTTFGGLAPMIFETSRQARFLIPMAISLGFGIVFATLITLVLVPSLYMILEDIKGTARNSMEILPEDE